MRAEQTKPHAPAEKKPKEAGLFSRLLTRLGIPAEILPGGFGMTFSGRSERGRDGSSYPGAESLSVRGCRRILHYDESEIRLLLTHLTLIVTGHDLRFASFSAGTVTVVGAVRGVTFQ